jgi:hypothetical protein
VKFSSIVFSSVVMASVLGLSARVSQAQVWRCAGEDCEDAIVNDVADVTVRDWPAVQGIAIAGLPYSCLTKHDQCPHCLTGDSPAGGGDAQLSSAPPGGTTQAVKTGTVPWSVVLSGSLRSFLFGTYSASADVLATVQPSVGGSWGGTAINYSFLGACSGTTCSYVPAPGGDTGVVDLGAVNFSTAAGDFWNASLPFSFTVSTPDIITSCTIGYAPNTVTVNPGGHTINVSYPVAWTPVKDALAEVIRNQFRRAARLVVTGSP